MKKLEFMVNGNELWCGNCAYFHQHYVPDTMRGGFCACNGGHCEFPRMKLRCALQNACDKFICRNEGNINENQKKDL